MYRTPRNNIWCAVSFREMNLPVSDERALEILQSPPLSFELMWDFFGSKIVFFARNMVGKPDVFRYRRGAHYNEAPATIDCSSMIWWLYSLMGIELERRSIDQRRQGQPVRIGDVRAGDLVFTTGEGHDYWYEDEPEMTIGHVALATGPDSVIHATRQGILEEDVRSFLKTREFRDIRRIVPDEDDFYVFRTDPDLDIRSTIDVRWRILQNL